MYFTLLNSASNDLINLLFSELGMARQGSTSLTWVELLAFIKCVTSGGCSNFLHKVYTKLETFPECISQNNHTHSSDPIVNQMRAPFLKKLFCKVLRK